MGRHLDPTRANLLALQRRIAFTEEALDVLSRRERAITFDLEGLVADLQASSRALATASPPAAHRAALLRAMEGAATLDSLAMARPAGGRVSVTDDRRHGLHLPRFTPEDIETSIVERGYGFVETPPAVDEMVDAYEDLLTVIAEVASARAGILVLAGELEGLSRRVNAIRYRLLPTLLEQRTRIARHLDEQEREEMVRRRWFKRKHERRERQDRRVLPDEEAVESDEPASSGTEVNR